MDLAELLGAELMGMRDHEHEMRVAFAAKASGHLGSHHHLVDVFAGTTPASLVFSPDPKAFPTVAALRASGDPGVRVAVGSIDAFRTNFNRLFPNVLSRLQPLLAQAPLFVAGGAVLRALTAATEGAQAPPRAHDWWGTSSDVDFFVHAQSAPEASAITQRVYDALAVDGERWLLMRCRGVINLVQLETYHPSPWSQRECNKISIKVQSALVESGQHLGWRLVEHVALASIKRQ